VSAPAGPSVVVVGGGIAGLAAAWEVCTGAARDGRAAPVVHVVESDRRVGGKLLSAEVAGRTVDLAADAFLARRPEATRLCHELGLDDELVAVGATGASLWARGRLRPLPSQLNLGVPTRWWPLARSGILDPAESLRVARDVLLPHRGMREITGDRSVGELVAERLGRPVVERMVDPLVGGIHAGNVDQLSAAATFPLLLAASHQPGSLMHRLGRARSAPPQQPGPGPGSGSGTPLFWSLAGGTADLADRLALALSAHGVTIHTGVRVDAVHDSWGAGRKGPRWRLDLAGIPGTAGGPGPGGGSLTADGVVLAVPAPEAAVLLAPHAPRAAGLLSTVEYASVAVVTFTVPRLSVQSRLSGTGFLVPRMSTVDGRPALVTGCTYLGRKWPHLARPDDELLRASVGRFGDERHRDLDDDELCASAFGDLAAILGIGGTPLHSRVTRWDRAFPQYPVGHLIKVAQIEQEVAGLGGLAVAGAALRGVGIPACVASGRGAGERVLAEVSGGERTAGRPGSDGPVR